MGINVTSIDAASFYSSFYSPTPFLCKPWLLSAMKKHVGESEEVSERERDRERQRQRQRQRQINRNNVNRECLSSIYMLLPTPLFLSNPLLLSTMKK